MKLRLPVAIALCLAGAPVLPGVAFAASPGSAAAVRVHRSAAHYDGTRCTMQQVHTPAGKMVHNAPIVRCRGDIELVRRDRTATGPGAASTGRD